MHFILLKCLINFHRSPILDFYQCHVWVSVAIALAWFVSDIQFDLMYTICLTCRVRIQRKTCFRWLISCMIQNFMFIDTFSKVENCNNIYASATQNNLLIRGDPQHDTSSYPSMNVYGILRRKLLFLSIFIWLYVCICLLNLNV